MKIYISGQIVDESEAKISVLDHGLLYGDGIFEGIRVYEGCIFKLKEHLERLDRSANAIMLRLPWTHEFLQEAIVKTCRANDLKSGYIRLVVTRGTGSLGLSPESCKKPELIIIADQIHVHDPRTYTQGIKIITSPQRQISSNTFPPLLKSLNYLKNVVAKMEVARLGYQDALILNAEGYVVEAIVENVFIVRGGELITPATSTGALEGITRRAVLELTKKLGIQYRREPFTRYDVWNADECFLTGTASEIVPVVEVDGRPIGKGKPGPITLSLTESFKTLVKTDGVRV